MRGLTFFRKTNRLQYGVFPGGFSFMRFRGCVLAVLALMSFVGLAQSQTTKDLNDPLSTLAAYYDAINARDYRRAYSYWDSPTTSFERFAAGFADTDRVRVLVEPSARVEGAAGSAYADVSTIVVATTKAGNERVFAGCYVMRRSNVQDRGWKIYRADVSQVPSSTRLSRMLSQACRN
jgi:hypothetical protein